MSREVHPSTYIYSQAKTRGKIIIIIKIITAHKQDFTDRDCLRQPQLSSHRHKNASRHRRLAKTSKRDSVKSSPESLEYQTTAGMVSSTRADVFHTALHRPPLRTHVSTSCKTHTKWHARLQCLTGFPDWMIQNDRLSEFSGVWKHAIANG